MSLLYGRLVASMAAAAAMSILVIVSANAQNPPQAAAPRAGGPSPAKQAVENRKAVYTLIGNYFRYFGGVAKGTIPFDETEARKRAARIAFLSGLVDENFPDASNVGEPDSKAKADIWVNRSDFDKKLKEFQAHASAFTEVIEKEKGATDAFKSAVAALGQDCKGCHDSYKVK
jgi:cytochrome c556